MTYFSLIPHPIPPSSHFCKRESVCELYMCVSVSVREHLVTISILHMGNLRTVWGIFLPAGSVGFKPVPGETPSLQV